MKHSQLYEMDKRIKAMEKLALELKELGREIPAIERNVNSLLSFVNLLKYNVSDILEVE